MKIITGIMLGSCIVSLLFTVGVAAQSAAADLAGARFVSATNPVADTNARFTLGLRLEGETSYRTTARLSDRVSITGTIRPETAHIGMTADIFVVDRVNLAFMMKDQNGVFRDWNGRVPDLRPTSSQPAASIAMSMAVSRRRAGPIIFSAHRRPAFWRRTSPSSRAW